MSIVDCAHHAEVRTHAKRKLQLHCQLQAAHILAASAASLLISFFIHRSICRISTCVFIYMMFTSICIDFEVWYTDIPESTFFQRQDTTCLRFMATDKSLIQKLRWVWPSLLPLSIFESMKCNIKWFADFAEHEANFWMSEWLANIQRNQMNHDSSLCYYIILISLGVKQDV